ncbi:MAG: hypothetical protein REI12_07575 [Pedobacter sp.]|nr:hypothetical protein [Pedobacter sp.]
MKYSRMVMPLLLATMLGGCATAPPEPSVQMRPIESYANLDCQQMGSEITAVSTWQQHYTDTNVFMEKQASSMRIMDTFGSVLTAVGSAVDPSMAGMYQESNKSSALATAQTENAQAQAATHQAGLSKRQSALKQLFAIKGCPAN